MGQFMSLARRQDEGHRAPAPVGDPARLGAVAPARAAQRLTLISRRAVGPLFSAPAALGCARMLVPSRNVIPSWTPRSWATLLGQEQQPLPPAQVGPADEGLSRSRPGTQVRRDGAPLGPVLMAPEVSWRQRMAE